VNVRTRPSAGRGETLALNRSTDLADFDPKIRSTSKLNALVASQHGGGHVHPLKMESEKRESVISPTSVAAPPIELDRAILLRGVVRHPLVLFPQRDASFKSLLDETIDVLSYLVLEGNSHCAPKSISEALEQRHLDLSRGGCH
jgi:hypothetical protein